MGWDSNPRGALTPAGFQDRSLQPLGHPSGFEFNYLPQCVPPGNPKLAPDWHPGVSGSFVKSAPARGVDLGRGFGLHVGKSVRVQAEGDRDRGMAGAFADHLRVDARAEQASCFVPQCDGIDYCAPSTREILWDRYYTAVRQSIHFRPPPKRVANPHSAMAKCSVASLLKYDYPIDLLIGFIVAGVILGLCFGFGPK